MLTTKFKQLGRNTELKTNPNQVINALIASIKTSFSNNDIPCNREGLLMLAKSKNETLNSLLSVNFAKKERKAIDFLCEYRFDISGGYQGFKNVVDAEKKSIMDIIDRIIETDMPENMILAFDADDYLLYNVSNVETDFTPFKHSGFNNELIPNFKDKCELKEDGVVEVDDIDAISIAYSLHNLLVDKGSDNSDSGLGNSDCDIKTMVEHFGFGVASDIDYFSMSQNDRPFIIMIASRPSNEELLMLKEIVSNYE